MDPAGSGVRGAEAANLRGRCGCGQRPRRRLRCVRASERTHAARCSNHESTGTCTSSHLRRGPRAEAQLQSLAEGSVRLGVKRPTLICMVDFF